MQWIKYLSIILTVACLLSSAARTSGQSYGTLQGTITLADGGTPLHGVVVTIVQLRRTAVTDESGKYTFEQVPPGNYTVLSHLEGFPDVTRSITVTGGGITTLDLQLRLSGLREEVTVTATGTEQSTFEAFQSVTTLDATRIAEESHTALGEVLDKEPGVAKRSFGPGSARPVIRGFDGDRVLVLQDGIRMGSLASQSADHGEPVDVLSLERLEVLKGPATLLYGSNAIGGVVNAITGHQHAHKGWRGYFTGVGGTTNNQGGISGGGEYGTGRWLFWGSGSGQRTGDYDTPIGRVPNSKTRAADGTGGFSWYGDKGFFSASYSHDNRRYGVPFAAQFEGGEAEETVSAGPAVFKGNLFNNQVDDEEEEQIDLKMRRHEFQVNTGFRNLGAFVDSFRLTLDYSDYQHKELEGPIVGTVFNNKQFVYRGVFDQRRSGRLSGSFGFSGFHRDYEAIGAETLAPPVIQNSFAVFGLQSLDFERVAFQFGGRVEHNSYKPVGLTNRSFTGFSGAAGIRIPLWEGGAFVANYTHSYRAPALEELYNFGPHIGNLTFEISNPNLRRELSNGIDLSLRHRSSRVQAEANFYYYNLRDFVFLAPTGEITEGLIEARYLQGDSRYMGTELGLDIEAHRNFWINLGLDAVDAQLKESGTPLPRIPPLRARIGFDARYKGLSIRPEIVMVNEQDEIFPTETRTAGYALFNLLASYTIARPHYAHIFSVNAFNLGDKLYRNHLSFIKELAPEIGRGARFTYTVRFF